MENNDKNEILEAIGEFSNRVDERFEKIESTMVTKDYLDDKLSDLRGDLVVLVRKEDVKLGVLVEILKNKKVINEDDVKQISSLEPFAKLL